MIFTLVACLRKENIGAIFIMGRVDLVLRCWLCNEMG